METLHSHRVKSEILWNFKQLIDISPVMAASQRKPACLICPSSWDINPPLMGIYRQDKYPLLGGFSSSISFGPTASCLLFGHAWDTAEPCKEGCWLEGRWVADRARSGELRSRRTYLHEIPTFGYPSGLACALAWCHLTQFAALGCWGLTELAAWAQSQFVWLVWLCTAFLAGWAVICVSCHESDHRYG